MKDDIETCNREFATALCGNTVMMDGGVGFQNADIFRMMSENLIRQTAESLAHCINTQGLPWFIASRWGLEALHNAVAVEYDTSPPQDKKVQADTFDSLGRALQSLIAGLALAKRTLNVDEIAARFGVPLNEQNPVLMSGAEDSPTLNADLVAPAATTAPAKTNGIAAHANGAGKPETSGPKEERETN